MKAEIRTAAKLSGPALVTLAVLAGFGRLDPGTAVAAALAVVAAVALFARTATRKLEAKLERTERAGASPTTEGSENLDTLERILDALPDPLLVLDRSRRVVRSNAAARALLGGASAGRDLAMSLRQPAVLEAAEAVLSGGGARDVGFTLPGPVERTFAGRIVPLAGASPDEAAALAAFHDLTAVREAERMRADFVANASHELKTPLSTLLGSIETLRGPGAEDPAAYEKFLPLMHAEAARMARLVEDLLSLSRIERNEHSPPEDRLDVGSSVRTAAENLDLEARARDMVVALELAESLGPVVGDAEELGQAWRNLIDNAIKYGRAGSTITVRTRAIAADATPPALAPGIPAIAVAVIDRGEGIAPEHLPRLTERFYRVDGARSRALGGTGLGLAIVKHIVNRHGGVLTVDSQPDQGSTFTVYLPAAASAPDGEADEVPVPAASSALT